MRKDKSVALVFAGGVGSRMNRKIPKQMIKINNKEIIIHVLEIFEKNENINEIYISFVPELIKELTNMIDKYGIKKVKKIVPGGKSGQESIYNSLKEIEKNTNSGEDPIVLIHDGVRPFITDETINGNINLTIEKGNAITTTPATETIAVINSDNEIQNIFDRSKCTLAQAPQTFRLSQIITAHKREHINKTNYENVIDSSTLIKKHFPEDTLNTLLGDVENIKITTENDLIVARGYFDHLPKFKKE